MSNFINDVINADAILDKIDDYIEKWHDSDTDCSVFEYLGMTEEEYFLWVENDFYLKYIISAHEKDININELLKEEYTSELVACPSSPEEAKKIYNWLKEKGMIE